jgi:hypothetical protein
MKVIISATEMSVIESNFNTITEIAAPLFEISPEEMRKNIIKGLGSLSVEMKYGECTITIPENKVIEYFDILGRMYALAFKIAKIVKPTIELIMSECKEEILILDKKIKEF